MKFSLVNGQRQEAQPNLSGKCPACDQAMVAKCGEFKVWHWAHKGRRACDVWWENETEWHRAWKGRFPETWQEVVHQADNGEKHIADVNTDQGWVIEFQHSHIRPEERRSRDAFYPKLVWVVNGARRKRDSVQFLNALNRGRPIGSNARIRIPSSDECAILGEWAGSHAPVFIDFGVGPTLWWILSGTPGGSADVAPFSRSDFIEIHRGGATQKAREFEEFVNELRNPVSRNKSHSLTQASKRADPLAAPVVPRYQMYTNRRRRRL
jgi:competence protein CoiA